MVDLETLGNTPGCAILSIGAVGFDPKTGNLSAGHYDVVSARSCRRLGLHTDPDTVAWWARQSPEAQRVLVAADGDDALDLEVALGSLNDFIRETTGGGARIWGNGADFDNAILSAAFRAAAMRPAWLFWNNRCYRTLKSLRPEIKLERSGTHHNALDDARTQAKHAIALLSVAA